MKQWSKEEIVVHQRIVGLGVLVLSVSQIFRDVSQLLVSLVIVLLAAYWLWPAETTNFFSYGLKK